MDLVGKMDGGTKGGGEGTETLCSPDKPSLEQRGGYIDLQQARQFVDIRMTDFAHTTHVGYVNDHIRYTGPNEGYIVGLDTLIGIFEKVLHDASLPV